MNKNLIRLIAFVLITSSILVVGCKKEDALTIPPQQVHFLGNTVSSYYVTNDPNSTYKIPVGLTSASNVARTINYTVSSPTGAASGQQYTITSNSITIPAGKSLDSIPVKGIFSGYPAGRKDTLIITLTGGDIPVSDFDNVYKLVLQKYCLVDINTFVGTYTKSYDLQTGQPTYGPYETEITNPATTGTNKGTIKILNFWDVGTSITAELDYTDPAGFKLTIPSQFLYNDATYGAATIKQVGNGTFSSCDNTFTFSYTVTVAAGSFGNFTTTIAR